MTTTKPPVLNDDDEEFNNWHVSYASRPPNLNAPEGMWVDDKKAYAAWKYAKAQAVLERAGVDAVRDAALGEAMNAVPLDKMSSLQGATVIEAIRALKVTPAAAVADALPVIPGTPPRIWLVLGDDGDEPANFDELGEVTWCAHPQGPGDIEYVLAAPQAGQLSGNAGDVEPRPLMVTRTSENSVMLGFRSCREASVYERAAIAASKEGASYE